ncbi:ATP-binding protein [Streptomyces sp. ME02-8801-2C]|uniref:ATP-binding protein n=1 Tax=Streptomyces sp. ME02-8801-2C TaxID=3028680 RepID=UPI0029AEC2C0|nr:ATP-binding protein [Streptomyces sp. ME02-8801-2C]MDX3454517.1 ATP-binding protein [Streptomyces sp. ME02-8801-2C]
MLGCEVTEPRPRCVLPFEAAPAEVRLLRKAAIAQLDQWGMLVAADEVALLVTELATNVIKHVGEGVAATLILEWRSERLRVEVHDKSRMAPELKAESCDQECGRGLHLIGGLAVDWGTVLMAAGKAVWCEIQLNRTGACGRIERAVGVLESYQGVVGTTALRGDRKGTGFEESAIELVTDLLHWTAARGNDPDDILDRAQMHYEAEADAA